MNSTTSGTVNEAVFKKAPVIQDTLFDATTSAMRTVLHQLIDSMTDGEIQRGNVIVPSGKPTFRQTDMPFSVIKEVQTGTFKKPHISRIMQYTTPGRINCYDGKQLFCPICGRKLYGNGTATINLNDLPYGGNYNNLLVTRQRWLCSNPECGYTWIDPVEFKAQHHHITIALENYTRDLLQKGLTLKEVSIITGLNKNTVKEIDKVRLQELYTIDGKELRKPAYNCECLGIDEFLLHEGYKYATIIIDLKTGHVLYLAHGKKKQTVKDFINWIGIDWMKNVKAVACDMNSDFDAYGGALDHLRRISASTTQRNLQDRSAALEKYD